ncbi:hypothetical protein EGW08_008426, partial [Elysia chlorotica]
VFSSSKPTHTDAGERKPTEEEQPDPIIAPRESSSSSQGRERDQTPTVFNNISDVETIRQASLAAQDGCRSYTPSECSTSSHTSCPDPSGLPMYSSPLPSVAQSPHLFTWPSDVTQKQVGPDNDGAIKDGGSPCVTSSSPPVSAAGSENEIVKEIMMSPPRQRSRRVLEEDAYLISPLGRVSAPLPLPSPGDKWSKAGALTQSDIVFTHSGSPSSLKARANNKVEEFSDPQLTRTYRSDQRKESPSVSQPKVELDDAPELCDDIYDVSGNSHSHGFGEERDIADRNMDTVDPGNVKLDPLEQDAILKKVLCEIDLQADKDREARDLAERWKARNIQSLSQKKESSLPQHSTPPSDNSLPSGDTGKALSKTPKENPKSEQVKLKHEGVPVKKNKDAINEKDKESSLGLEIPVQSGNIGDDRVDTNIYGGRTVLGEDNEDELESGRFGNSLGSMTGWSSEIDPSVRPQQVKEREEHSRTESFAAMLRSYMPGSLAPDAAVTLDQVIEDLPAVDAGGEEVDGSSLEDDPDGQCPGTGGEENTRLDYLRQRQDSCLDGFEVLEPPDDNICGQVEANSSRMIYLYRVPQEHGLSHQNFTCRGCNRPIGIIYGQPRLCAFDGGLYCYECHENMEIYIPSSIVFDWDFRKKKVCSENHRFLTELESQALYDLEKLNPKLYSHVPELQDLKILRQRLCYLKSYLFTCSAKMAESLRQKIWPREHLYDHRDLYSVTDLLQVQSGALQRLVKELVRFSSQHVYSCALCSQKGYVCEICRNARIIYAFEVDTTIRCERCKAVYHRTCMTEGLPCPKCERWGRRSNSSIVQSHPEDYGSSPVDHSQFPPHSSPHGSMGSR